MMTDTAPAPRRGRRIFLILSLCLNVFLVAAILVGVMRAVHRHNDPMTAGGPFSPYALLHEVAREDRPKIQAVIDRHKATVRTLRDQAVAARVASFEVFAAPDYTPAKFTAALEKVRAADAAVGKEVTDSIAESAAQLTPAERKTLADRARRHASWFGDWLKKKH